MTYARNLIEVVLHDLQQLGDGPIAPAVAEDLHCTQEDAETLLAAVVTGTLALGHPAEIALISTFVIGMKVGQKVAWADALDEIETVKNHMKDMEDVEREREWLE